MGARLLEKVVEIKGHPRQIPRILQEREQREENRHWRQHHRHYPGDCPIQAVYQRALQPPGGLQSLQNLPQRLLLSQQQPAQQLAGDVGAHHGQPQRTGQQQEHHRDSSGFGGQQTVQLPVPALSHGVVLDGHTGRYGRRAGHIRRRTAFRTVWTPGTAVDLRSGRRIAGRVLQQLPQGVQTPPATRRRARYRTAQFLLKSMEVNLNALFCRLVQQVHADYHRPRNLQDLQRQSQIPLQTGGVRYHQRDIRLSGQQIVPCDLLLGAAGVEGVGPGQIDQGVGFVVICIDACGGGYGLARPVAGVLVQMGQSVENRGLSNVRIACQGDGRPRRGICCHRNHPSLSSAG